MYTIRKSLNINNFYLSYEDTELLGIEDLSCLNLMNSIWNVYYIFSVEVEGFSIPKDVAFIKIDNYFTSGRIEIELVYVIPEYRDKKLGTHILEKIIPILFGNPFCEKICISTEENNIAALKLYDKFFSREGLLRKHSVRFGEREDRINFGLLKITYNENRKSTTTQTNSIRQ